VKHRQQPVSLGNIAFFDVNCDGIVARDLGPGLRDEPMARGGGVFPKQPSGNGEAQPIELAAGEELHFVLEGTADELLRELGPDVG